MKLSNIMLTIVAAALASTAFAVAQLTVSNNPTSVLSVNFLKTDGELSVKMPNTLSEKQVKNLLMATSIGKHDGHDPNLLPAIILKETQAGAYPSYNVAGQEYGLNTNNRYYGIAQIKLAAAKDVLGAYPQLRDDFEFHTKTDEEIIAKLIENDTFNMSIASKYLVMLKRYGYDTPREVALAYNQGPGGAKRFDANTHQYSVGVMKHMQSLTKAAQAK